MHTAAKASVEHRIVFYTGTPQPHPEYVVFRIVNTSDRPIQIERIGWRIGILKKLETTQGFEPALSSALPATLAPGEEGIWMVPMVSTRGESWLESMAKGILTEHPRIVLRSLRAQFVASTGRIFEAKPDDSLRALLKKACADQRR